MALRGGRQTRERAAALGVRLIDLPSAAALGAFGPSLVVVDDPSAAAATRWVRRARRAGVPVASVHDLGLAYVASDLLVDGSVRAGAPPPGSALLAGPAYAILDPAVTSVRRARPRPRAGRVLMALGGGRHVRGAAVQLSAAMAGRVPHADFRVARGFASSRAWPALAHGSWIEAPDGLAGELAEASVAVVAGGVTLYEACALGVPAIAVAVTAAQRQTIRAMARLGAVIDGGGPTFDAARCDRVADQVARLLASPPECRRQMRAARRLVDGRGAWRVARRLHALAAPHRAVARTGQEVRRAA